MLRLRYPCWPYEAMRALTRLVSARVASTDRNRIRRVPVAWKPTVDKPLMSKYEIKETTNALCVMRYAYDQTTNVVREKSFLAIFNDCLR